jgi:hypothetical protein
MSSEPHWNAERYANAERATRPYARVLLSKADISQPIHLFDLAYTAHIESWHFRQTLAWMYNGSIMWVAARKGGLTALLNVIEATMW